MISDIKANQFLDVTAEICPMSFVVAKLRIETMPSGDILEVRLNPGEALENVPRAMAECGHAEVARHAEPGGAAWRVLIRKGAA